MSSMYFGGVCRWLLLSGVLVILQLLTAYQTRDQAIKKCINTVNENVQQLRKRKEKNQDDIQALKDLGKEQTKVKLSPFL